MSFETVYAVGAGCLCIGGIAGFVGGRYVSQLISEIRMLREKLAEAEEPKPFIEKPTVTMGVLERPAPFSNMDTSGKSFGIVETKSPELLDAENMEAVKQQVLRG